jgi:TPP-dependent pyruvate/acetoin dehydrogenase alpha subunit
MSQIHASVGVGMGDSYAEVYDGEDDLKAAFFGDGAWQNAQVFADMLNVRHNATKGSDD